MTTKVKQRGLYKVSYEKIGELLKLDDDHQVISVEILDNSYCGELLKVLVDGPCMPEVPEGSPIPYVPINFIDQVKKEIKG